MEHVVAHPRPGTLIFRTWSEGVLLWRMIVLVVAFRSLVIMPDHLHAVVERTEEKQRLIRRLVAYAQARNAMRGERGPVWSEGIGSTMVHGGEHARRTDRYNFLNPCRAGLVADPLAWPLSSYRDSLGLAIPGVHAAHPDPASLHEYVSSDPSVNVSGTWLPQLPPADAQPPSLEAVRAAVSALTRTTASELRRRGPARSLLLRAAAELTGCSSGRIGRFAGVDPSTVRRAASRNDARVRLVARVVGDERFPLLHEADLRNTASWRRYRGRR